MMQICPKCGREMPDIRSNSLVSNLCEDCYERQEFYTPDIEYPMPKRFIERPFHYAGENGKLYSSIQILFMLDEQWDELYQHIKDQGRKEKYLIAMVFNEISYKDAMREFVENGNVTLRCSYFFTNSLLDCATNYEDRNKDRHGFMLQDD